MKRQIRQIFVLAIIAIAIFLPVAAQEKMQEVKIYLRKTGADYASQHPSGWFEVKRAVDAKSPLRSALEILTVGSTADEEKNNLSSSTFGIELVSLRIKNKTAYTSFTMSGGAAFPGENAPFIFIEAVEKTALQFKGVKKVVVCLDGVLNFWSEDDEAPTQKCK